MKILYLGRNTGTSGHRAKALGRMGHEVMLIDPYALVSVNRLLAKWNRHTGGLGVVEVVRRRIIGAIGTSKFDLAWIDHGAIVNEGLVRELKHRIRKVICYSTDDPFGSRDRRLWREFLKAVPFYDMLVVVRAVNVDEAYHCGAQKVLRVFMSADEVAHAPRQLTAAEREEWKSEVLFVGTAFPERGPFLATLIELGVPLTLYGNRYQRLPEWPALKPHWRPGETESPDRYSSAISAAKVCLGLLSKGNRDLHTTRSMEIPSLGGVLCAERTVEHSGLYVEDEEAVFWSSPVECAAKCFALLANRSWRVAVAEAGHRRYLKNPWRNNQVVQDILEGATDGTSLPDPTAIRR